MSTNIQVAVRVRPFLPFEAGSKSCIDVLPGDGDAATAATPGAAAPPGRAVRIRAGHASSAHAKDGHTFTFDQCFSGLATQVELYRALVVPLLQSCLEGYNATTLAYGQTGAGKTYTTLGPATSPDFFAARNNGEGLPRKPEHDAVGLLPRALRDLFGALERKQAQAEAEPASADGEPAANADGSPPAQAPPSKGGLRSGKPAFEYQVRLQFLELYGEEVRDLLAAHAGSGAKPAKIIIRDSAGDAEALGATAVPVATAREAMVALTRGMLRRVTGATAMNAESSRSHAIMSVQLEQVTRTAAEGEDGEEATVVRRSKYNFVDLAGSERSKRTHAKGQRLREGININKGLLVLGNVIAALAAGDKFVPFRDSKLTRLLRGSLGGNHKTLMIACASPSGKNAEESLNCLRYANRAKNIQNKATVNVDPHSRLVNALRGQVTALAGELLRISKRGGGKVDNDRFAQEMLEVLVKGGKDAQSIIIGGKQKPKGEQSTSADAAANAAQNNQSASISELTAELEKTRLSLKETQCELSDKAEQLEAVVSERDGLRRVSEDHDAAATPAETTFSVATPSKAIGMSRRESIRDIVTGLGDAGGAHSPDAISEGSEDDGSEDGGAAPTPPPRAGADERHARRIEELAAEADALRAALERGARDLADKAEELEAASGENEALRETLRNTPDIDDETIHYIVKNITSYDEQRMEAFRSEDGGDETLSVASSGTASSAPPEEDELRRRRNEDTETFASAMFSTGKFLVDLGMFQDSIVCFETVLEARRRAYGWDDPLVGDALHMEGFVRSKMGDYDRALMLLWDALRIRKIASDPLKISATLRLLADLHFSKDENMHAALFYEECARHLKEHDIQDPHLPLVLIDLARTKDRLGEYVESMNFFEEALGLYGHALEKDDDRIASLQYEMGVLAFQMGERGRGEECFRHFIRIRKLKGTKLDEGVANALFVLGSLHWATKKREMAQNCWHEALDIFKGLGRTDDDPYVKSLKEKIHRAQRRPIARIFRGS